MLDTSLPYHAIIMQRSASAPVPEAPLPHGYSLRTYQPGDEQAWAEIETAVLEYDSIADALEDQKAYSLQPEERRRRQWFAIDPDGQPVATVTAWFTQKENGRIPTVHALGCLPDHQGQGLGRAVTAAMLGTFRALDPGTDVWLDTQTWSYMAVGLYLELGFVPMKTARFNDVANAFDLAVPVLKQRMRADLFQKFLDRAE